MNYLHSIADFWALCAHKTTNFMNNEYHTHRILFSHDRVLYSSSFLILPCLVVNIYIFLFLDQKVTSFCEKNPKRANPFWSFVYCTYSPLILLLGISHCCRLMPIFGTPPSTQLGKRGQRFAHWLPQKMCKKPHPNLNQHTAAQQPVPCIRATSHRFGRYLEYINLMWGKICSHLYPNYFWNY